MYYCLIIVVIGLVLKCCTNQSLPMLLSVFGEYIQLEKAAFTQDRFTILIRSSSHAFLKAENLISSTPQVLFT